jgi:prevent-host-death family protein
MHRNPAMKVTTVASAKSHLSALIDDVESGSEVVITRRGKAVARLVPEPTRALTRTPTAPEAVGWEALRAWVDAAPAVASATVAELRERDLL